jgi:hypothetical protein
VLAWLAARLAHLLPSRPLGQGGTPPLSLEVRLDAVAAVLLDGLSYRRAGRMVGISKTGVGDSLDLLLGPLAALGYCQPDGTFITSLDDLRQWLGEMAASGEAVVVDGLATRVQRPRGWANQRVLLDRGFRGMAKTREHWHAPVGDRRTKDRLTDGQRAFNREQAGLRALVEQSIAHLANAWALRRWRGLLHRVRDVFRAAGAAHLP